MEENRKLTHNEIVDRQSIKCSIPKVAACAILNNIRSLYNVGSIFRTADGAGFEKLWLCGITGCPPNPMIAKTALGAQDSVAWEYREDTVMLIRELKEKGYKIFLLEQTKKSLAYSDLAIDHLEGHPACLIVGNEISGVSDEILSLCDQAVEIEMRGIKNSLNVSVAFGIVAYHVAHFMLGR